MSGMRSQLASRLRSSSLSAVPPRPDSSEYSTTLARAAANILYRSPIPSKENRPIYILNAAALPDSREADFDSLLPYVLARLPDEDDLLRGDEYEVVFFAGDSDGSATTKKSRPGWGWFLQAYHVLSRAMRKRLQKLYIVHEKAWVRILAEIFSTIASPKFRKKIVHASTLTNLALHIPIEDLLIPPAAYLHDRRISADIFAPYASGRRAFAARQPFPVSKNGKTRLPRVLRETTSFVLLEENIVSEGLFRVPPHARLKDILMEAYDRGQKYIVWKDNGATLNLPPYPRAHNQDEIIAEIDPQDAYSVYMAAGLIKSWYSHLRQPIFPAQTYRDLRRLYGDPDEFVTLERLTDLLAPTSEWSFLPAISREILVRHLLPLLSVVAARQEQNKMTAENLAVCFAPALLCGPDQLEDAKMSSIVRRILTQAIELWSDGLRESCGVAGEAFSLDLRLPKDESDWEDPLESNQSRADTGIRDEDQTTGILFEDNDNTTQQPPPLPPRSGGLQLRAPSGAPSIEAATRRKPAPPLQVPPRYSTIISEPSTNVDQSPIGYTAVADGFSPSRKMQWEPPEQKKPGTSSVGDSHNPLPPLVVPKRKALTAEQIDNAGSASGEIAHLKMLATVAAPPGPAEAQHASPLSCSASPRDSPLQGTFFGAPSTTNAARPKTAVTLGTGEQPSPNDFRRPSWSVSTSREPNIASLARPVYPPQPTASRPASKSTSLPIPGTKPRAPSAALLRRMPSFETSNAPRLTAPANATRKLDLKKASVDDLRRLYEERAGTARTLVEAGKLK
ncbi:uncharacterized protein EI97DRAFT_449424 [Westerdykella ornata]|uniref:Rho GTPase activation protein n=1 Tax=Westerdykella ornata TaxID=318751 RepID=A0A6A6JNE8_WESOR|nr:uncharacterized protein EI97DRAFT_449424 [Westerdykella ornata]KAF2278042.1 hypothetical protein EI97DRAFT_449424 [Westerdykella ornata]